MTVQTMHPLRCPLCGRDLDEYQTFDVGAVTADMAWKMHAGRCPEHGWFQAEFISKPPREIFPVNRPRGTTRRLVIGGREFYQLSTIWDGMNPRQVVDPFDAELWKVDWERIGVSPDQLDPSDET